MSNPADISATLQFQKELIKLQDEYKISLVNKEHSEIKFYTDHLFGLDFNEKCKEIYEAKVEQLCVNIINQFSMLSPLNINGLKRLSELRNDAIIGFNPW